MGDSSWTARHSVLNQLGAWTRSNHCLYTQLIYFIASAHIQKNRYLETAINSLVISLPGRLFFSEFHCFHFTFIFCLLYYICQLSQPVRVGWARSHHCLANSSPGPLFFSPVHCFHNSNWLNCPAERFKRWNWSTNMGNVQYEATF